MTIKIFVVDDHIIFREGIKRVMADMPDIEIAGESGDGREAVENILANDYHLILLDLALPTMDGMDVLRTIKKHKPALPVLVLSMYGEDQYALRVLSEGASGYLTKESVPSDLLLAVRRVADGGRYVSDHMSEKMIAAITGNYDQIPHEKLSDREFQVYQSIVQGQSIKEIANKLNLARTTITSYRSRILEKMEMTTNADLIRYALERRLF